MAAGDVEAFVTRTYTPDAVILPPDGPVIQGHDGIREFWAAAAEQLQITGIQLISESVTPLSAVDAYEIGRGVIETANGAIHAKYVVIWHRDDQGLWRWHVDIWNGAPAPESGG